MHIKICLLIGKYIICLFIITHNYERAKNNFTLIYCCCSIESKSIVNLFSPKNYIYIVTYCMTCKIFQINI